MPRTARFAPGGMLFHVLNRGVGRMPIFEDDADYAAFEEIIAETLEKAPLRICAWCLMPNHWHFVVWPRRDGDLAEFLRRLTITHVTRWQTHRQLVGHGHLYQGRYKSFPIQADDHFYGVVRYVERNALQANLVECAEAWRWSSLWRRVHGSRDQRRLLADWPLPVPRRWRQLVNAPQTAAELESIRLSLRRGRPFGTDRWVRRTAATLGLESTLRPRGRPAKYRTEEA